MRIVAALLFLLLSQIAHADGVLRYPNGNLIVLKNTPCVDARVVPLIKAEFLPLFKTAAALWDGKPYAACWATHVNDPRLIAIIDETGDGGTVPRAAVEFDPEV